MASPGFPAPGASAVRQQTFALSRFIIREHKRLSDVTTQMLVIGRGIDLCLAARHTSGVHTCSPCGGNGARFSCASHERGPPTSGR